MRLGFDFITFQLVQYQPHPVYGVYAQLRGGASGGVACGCNFEPQHPAVGGYDLEIGRLRDNHASKLRQPAFVINKPSGPGTICLFARNCRENNITLQFYAGIDDLSDSGNRRGGSTLHIHRASAIYFAVAFNRRESRMLPGCFARADNVKMTGKKQSGPTSGGFYVRDNIGSDLVPAI